MKSILLTIDAVVNLLLGALLLLFPAGMLQFLGLPPVQNHFYTTILGGVIFGIGLALFIELFHGGRLHASCLLEFIVPVTEHYRYRLGWSWATLRCCNRWI